MLQFVCECDVVKDTGKEEYLPFTGVYRYSHWIGLVSNINLSLIYIPTTKLLNVNFAHHYSH